MTLANRLKLFIVVWFAVVMTAFTAIYATWFHAHNIAKYKQWLALELSDITSKTDFLPSSFTGNQTWQGDVLLPGSGVRFIDSTGRVFAEGVSPHFPGDLLQQFEQYMTSVKPEQLMTDENAGPLIQWFPSFHWSGESGSHTIIAAEAQISYPNGTSGMVQVFGTLDSVEEETGHTLRILVIIDLLTVVCLAIGAHILVNQGVRPITSLIDGIRSVEWAQTSRLTIARAPREIQSVVNSVNQLFERVEKGVRDQSRFIADASHELRTPLAIIAGHANILRRWGKTNEEVWEPAVHNIVTEVGRLQSLVDRLLSLSRLESGYRPIPEPLFAPELRDLLLQLRDDARVLRPDLKIKSLIHLSPQIETYISRDDLRQILVILVDNAMKHTQSGGHVDIMVNWDDMSVRFSVVDTGEGIPAHALANVFDRFYRAEESRARTFGGSGLGLSICKEMVEAYGGKIAIRSKEWRGTTVTVTLPREPNMVPGLMTAQEHVDTGDFGQEKVELAHGEK